MHCNKKKVKPSRSIGNCNKEQLNLGGILKITVALLEKYNNVIV